MDDFSGFALAPELLKGLDALDIRVPTPIQQQALPAILDGRDVIAQAPTGSGKTVAFGLGVLQRLDASRIATQALVLCPTRELADQVSKALRRLAVGIANLKLLTLCGGIPLGPQIASLQHAPHVVVGTPGRVQELLQKRVLSLGAVRTFVLDEADRMLDMGFEEQIRAVMKALPKQRQSLLFSATYPDAIRAIAAAAMQDVVEVSVGDGAPPAAIEQLFFEVEPARRMQALAGLLVEHRPESCVVFCNMRRETEEVVDSLAHYGFTPLALHGDMEQRDRDEVLVRFANRSCNVLVASDVAARGLDVEDLGAVVNYELPSDIDTYLHRIGRTARAGRSGLALSLVAPRDMSRALAIETQQGTALTWKRAAIAEGRLRNVPQAAMATLRIDAGRTDKLRAGDILGALTGSAGLSADMVGKIDVFATRAYVAVRSDQAPRALERLRAGKVKGRNFRVSAL